MNAGLWLTVIGSGIAGGFLDAMAGMGFGALSSTIMVSGGLPPTMVIGVVNLAKVGSGLVSGLSHWRLGNVRWPWVLPMLGTAVVGGVIASLVLTRLPEESIRLAIPIVLIAMGVLILYRFLWARPVVFPVAGGSEKDTPAAIPGGSLLTRSHRRARESPQTVVWLGSIGFIGGALNGLSGLSVRLLLPLWS